MPRIIQAGNHVAKNEKKVTPTDEEETDLNRKIQQETLKSKSVEAAALSTEKKRVKFPVILHQILSQPSYSNIITWLPHGRSWIVLNPKSFEKDVIPNYFDHSKLSSFFRQVNGWGFIRVRNGKDQNSYYHEKFLRGVPDLAAKICRPIGFKKSEIEGPQPDFDQISRLIPLPESTTLNHDSNSNSFCVPYSQLRSKLFTFSKDDHNSTKSSTEFKKSPMENQESKRRLSNQVFGSIQSNLSLPPQPSLSLTNTIDGNTKPVLSTGFMSFLMSKRELFNNHHLSPLHSVNNFSQFHSNLLGSLSQPNSNIPSFASSSQIPSTQLLPSTTATSSSNEEEVQKYLQALRNMANPKPKDG